MEKYLKEVDIQAHISSLIVLGPLQKKMRLMEGVVSQTPIMTPLLLTEDYESK